MDKSTMFFVLTMFFIAGAVASIAFENLCGVIGFGVMAFGAMEILAEAD